ncbi:hypothetical protein PANO111632_17490 [Paracoccus nototheniae]
MLIRLGRTRLTAVTLAKPMSKGRPGTRAGTETGTGT